MFNLFFNGNNYGDANIGQNTVIDFETLQNARKDLIGEIQAVIQYDDHLHKTNVELASSTWINIRNEELVHIGELLGLLCYLAPYQKQFLEEGMKEFNERMNKGE